LYQRGFAPPAPKAVFPSSTPGRELGFRSFAPSPDELLDEAGAATFPPGILFLFNRRHALAARF